MNFQQLKYFTVLCEYKNFSKAAESLFISQQGLSTAIANLEAEYSACFFIRSPGGLILTEDGRWFFAWAKDILTRVDECGRYFEGRGARQGIIRCASVYGAMREFAGELIKSFEQTYSGLSVYLREYKDDRCDAVVDMGEADLGFGTEPLDRSKFECRKVSSFTQVCLMHESHPWTMYDKIPISLLTEENLVAADEEFKGVDMFMNLCRQRGVHIEPKIRAGEVITIHRMVRDNYGVGLTDINAAKEIATPNTVWRRFADIDPTCDISIFRKKDMPLPRAARIFWDYVLRETEKKK